MQVYGFSWCVLVLIVVLFKVSSINWPLFRIHFYLLIFLSKVMCRKSELFGFDCTFSVKFIFTSVFGVKVFSLSKKSLANFQLIVRILQLVVFCGVICGLIFTVAFTSLTIGDVFASVLSLIPTGWGLLSVRISSLLPRLFSALFLVFFVVLTSRAVFSSTKVSERSRFKYRDLIETACIFFEWQQIAIALKPVMKKLRLWKFVLAIARLYDVFIGAIVFIPIAFLSWFPFVSTFQTRLVFNQAFSRGLEISTLLAGGNPDVAGNQSQHSKTR